MPARRQTPLARRPLDGGVPHRPSGAPLVGVDSDKRKKTRRHGRSPLSQIAVYESLNPPSLGAAAHCLAPAAAAAVCDRGNDSPPLGLTACEAVVLHLLGLRRCDLGRRLRVRKQRLCVAKSRGHTWVRELRLRAWGRAATVCGEERGCGYAWLPYACAAPLGLWGREAGVAAAVAGGRGGPYHRLPPCCCCRRVVAATATPPLLPLWAYGRLETGPTTAATAAAPTLFRSQATTAPTAAPTAALTAAPTAAPTAAATVATVAT